MNTGDWLEISVHVDGEAAEAVSEVLNRYGRGGAVVEHLLSTGLGAHDDADQWAVKAYIPTGDLVTRRQIEEALWHLGQLYPIPEPVFSVLTENDWAQAWKAHYSVLRIGRRTVIVPQWQSYAPQDGEVVIVLDPGMAFGTGTHPTTQLCLVALEERISPGMSVFDVGTGSGVLAIAAAKQGARAVRAVDVDEIAVATARDNVAVNGVADVVHVAAGSWEKASGQYDLIVINILAEVICSLLEQGLADALKPGGTLIASGIIDDREAGVRAALTESGIEVVGRHVERDWVALVGLKHERKAAG
ncbi:MAG: 50S ribosomal protein L11 methyltransferase [Anaerolineae bacterium]|nr:50S ribosomal protein L11 methyltransferase [Anaerolineae bacterium]